MICVLVLLLAVVAKAGGEKAGCGAKVDNLSTTEGILLPEGLLLQGCCVRETGSDA